MTIADLLRAQFDTLAEDLTDEVIATAGPFYAKAPRQQVRDGTLRILRGWQTALDTDDPAEMLASTASVTRARAASHVDAQEMMGAVDAIRALLWRLLRTHYATLPWEIERVERLESWIHAQRVAIIRNYGDMLREMEGQLKEREQQIGAQSELISELSAPILPILPGVLVVPLIGMLDTRRAARIMETVLAQTQLARAHILLLDITGISGIDTAVARHLIQLVQAVELLGAKVALVGVRAEIAHSLVQLGVDLDRITTLANLQSGVAWALKSRGKAVAQYL